MPLPASHADVAADGIVKASPGSLVAVLLAGGSANSSITLYDNASAASGTVLATINALANDSVVWSPAIPYVAANGIYADITGTGANATVIYL